MISSRVRNRKTGLTLIELVVVLVVLIALAGLVLPRVGNMFSQANSATDASIIADMNKAISTFETRYGQAPNGWDGILTGPNGSFYPNLHPNLQTSQGTATAGGPILTTTALTDTQLASLNKAGITFLHYNNDSNNATGRPSDSGTAWAMLASGTSVASLFVPTTSTSPAWTAHGSTFPDRAFNINPFNAGATDTFVVFGVGQPCSLRGASIQDSPIVQGATPTKYYARMLAVYHIPGPTASMSDPFAAQFVGTFCPDGTCINDNLAKYNSSDAPLGTN
ncbi:MAG TPA: hypothetical protein VG713_07845 [Pirellulales bacterium]|nr:hypothetical protein [Pirellulales bacterium]